MNYIKRDSERKFLHMSTAFKAVMTIGARQVGKFTMLKHLAQGRNRTYVTMDNTQLHAFAQTDPKLFLQKHILSTFENIWRCRPPNMQEKYEEQLSEYFNSYIETYLMWDAVDDYGISDTESFRKFLRAVPLLQGSLSTTTTSAISPACSARQQMNG